MPKKKTAPTSKGLTNTAYRELKTSFSASLKPKPKTVDASAPTSATVTPSPANPPRRSIRTSTVDSTPLQPTLLDSSSTRYDECHVPLSTVSRGMRRMRHRDVLRLRKGEDFTLVIPASDKKDNKHWRHQRESVLKLFKGIIGDAATRGEREETIESDLKQRVIMRDDKEYYEFNVRVHSYPERPRLEEKNLPEGEVNSLIDATAGVGIYAELRGYGTRSTALIKLLSMPYLEFYQPRKPHDPYLDESITFVRNGNLQRAIDHMACELHSLKGDTAAYVEIMMKYYRNNMPVQSRKKPNDQPTKDSPTETANQYESDAFMKLLGEEIEKDKLKAFARRVDKEYEGALIELASDSTVASTYLLPDDLITRFYYEFEEEFPLTHMVFAAIVSTEHYKIAHTAQPPPSQPNIPDTNETAAAPTIDAAAAQVQAPPPSQNSDAPNEVTEQPLPTDPLPKKKRIIFNSFLTLLRARSINNLTYWSLVNPMGFHFKGFQQPTSKSIAGSASCDQRTAWKRLDKIQEEGIQTMNERLQRESTVTVAFDNHQNFTQKKNVTDGKSSINHVGTSYLMKKDKPYELPAGTRMITPSGVVFVVKECEFHSNYLYNIKGIIEDADDADAGAALCPAAQADRKRINEGFLWPLVGWKVVSMPGFTVAREVTYIDQYIPPPRLAWVRANSSVKDIVLDRTHRIMQPESEGAEILETKKYQDCLIFARRLVNLRSHAFHLKKVLSEIDESKLCLAINAKLTHFTNMIDCVSKEIDTASKFQSEMVTTLNPKAGQVDRIFAWPITPHCETSYSGMGMVYSVIGESLQLFKVDDDGKATELPNAKDRKINLMVDQLSARNFRHLELHLTKKLAELGNAAYRSKHILTLRKCAYETFGKRGKRKDKPLGSQENNVVKLVNLFNEVGMYPKSNEVVRKMTSNLLWGYVKKPTNIGSKKDSEKEDVGMTEAQSKLYDRICVNEAERDDYDEFESDEDDDNDSEVKEKHAEDDISIVSSVGHGGSSCDSDIGLSDNDAPEDPEEEVTVNRDGENVKDGLKKLGNVKKRKMSTIILKDFLGKDGREALKGVPEAHKKSIETERRKITEVKKAVLHFEQKMQKRRKTLSDNMKKSKNNTYYRCEDWWRDQYDTMMADKRKK